MIKNILKITALLMLLGLWSCEKQYLNVNHDPNVLEEVPDAQVLLPTAQVNLANTLMGWELGFSGAFWSQYWTQEHNHSQFKFLCNYDPAKHGTAYNNFTSGILFDLQKIQRMAVEKDQKNLAFIAEVLEIYTWQMVTDIWGDVPYFEALKMDEGIAEPKYDKGQVIYTDLQKRIDALINKIPKLLEKNRFEERYDFVFGGNIENWTKFAYSLKLKLMIRLSETSGYDNAKTLQYVNSAKANFLSENAMISKDIWNDKKEGKRHPMREFQEGGAGYVKNNVIMCATFYEYLYGNGDNRLGECVDSEGKSAFFGDYTSRSDTDGDGKLDKNEDYSKSAFSKSYNKINTNLLNLVLMSTWEINFYVAEVYYRSDDYALAKTYYNAAVDASFNMYGLNTPDWTTFYAKWEDDKGLELISMQKWVSYANFQHYESFLERNRLKIPKVWSKDIKINRQDAWSDYTTSHLGEFTISVEGRGTLGGRLPSAACYPDYVLARNSNSPNQKINLSTKIWWDKKPENIVN